MRLRTVIIGTLGVSVVAGFYLGAFSVRRLSVVNMAALPVVDAKANDITLLFVGDIMLSRNVAKVIAEKKDPRFPFAHIASTTEAADLAFGNLENPVSGRGVRSGSIYSFRAEPNAALEGLLFAGFDIVSLANNHIWDYGKEALIDTYEALERNGIDAVGAGADYESAHTPRIRTVGGVDIAFLAYTNLLPKFLGLASSSPAIARFDDEILRGDIAAARAAADIVVVSFHWGDEYQTKHNIEQERVAKLAIDAGATIVVGHHPHVVQEVEEYHGGWIFYSLGNFLFDQNFSEDTKHGLLAEVIIRDGKVVGVKKRGIAFTDDYQPHLPEETKTE